MPGLNVQTSMVEFFQSWSPPGGLSWARLFSELGGENFYLLLIPALIWFGRWETGVKIGRVVVLTDLLGEWLKWTLQWPRPDQALALASETSPGFVSTHAALSMSVAVLLGAQHKLLRPWLAAWVLLVGWSRLYLGVHFPLDILGGWTVGLLVAMLVSRWGGDRRLSGYRSLSLALLITLFWPQGGGESLQRDLGLLFGFELGLFARLRGHDSLPPPTPLGSLDRRARLFLVLLTYVGLNLIGCPRALRYLAVGLVVSWRPQNKV